MRRDERGAAVVEFVMVATLMVFLLFAVLQVAVYFYVRNIAAASAAAGARFAAGADVPDAAGAPRAQAAVRSGLGGAAARELTCTAGEERDAASGLPVSIVRCRGPLRLIFLPLASPMSIDVTGRSLMETRP